MGPRKDNNGLRASMRRNLSSAVIAVCVFVPLLTILMGAKETLLPAELVYPGITLALIAALVVGYLTDRFFTK